MKKPSLGFRRLYLPGLAVTFLIVPLMLIDPEIFTLVELKLLDSRVTVRGESEHGREIVIVSIDDKSISKIGKWPWGRGKCAQLIDRLKHAGAKVIAFDVYFQDIGGGVLTNEDKELVESVRRAGNVILPVYFSLNRSEGSRGGGQSEDTRLFAIKAVENRDLLGEYAMVKGYDLFSSFPELNRAASGMGHINMIADMDGVVRKDLMIVNHENRYIPSLGLRVAQEYLCVANEDVTLIGGEGVRLGDREISISPVETGGVMVWGFSYINYRGGYRTFDYVSFVDVINDRFPTDTFRDKIVIVGATAAGLYDLHSTPFAAAFPGAEKQATVADNVIHGDFIQRPFHSDILSAILCILIGLTLTFLIPGMRLLHAIIMLCVITGAIVAGGYAAITRANLWINITYPIAATWIVFLVSVLNLYSSARREQARAVEESHETTKMLGLSYQEKGSLELAYETFNKLPLNNEVMGLLYNLAMQLEKKRKDSLAMQIYKKIHSKDRMFGDVARRLSAPGFKTAESSDEDTLPLRQGQTLGRYEIVRQIGKGAMGEVYLARDAHIDRYVATKTFRFSREMDEESLQRIKRDLLREARMAGQLSHPNIVTIYDAGEDWDLSYIAMEVVEGVELTANCNNRNFLAYERVIEIISSVAEALDYAHDNGIIHRDIKPANIMIQQAGDVKITDFGIACVKDQNRDHPELAGTPAYMSPEQISRGKIDARTDFYSLGVVFFELLTGEKPFTAPDLKTLAEKIANTPVPRLRQIRRDIPEQFQPIINRLMEKDKEKRYRRGADLVNDVKKITIDTDTVSAPASTFEDQSTIRAEPDQRGK